MPGQLKVDLLAVLLQGNLLSVDNIQQNWLTWWIGDMLGVMIFLPLTFMLFARPRALWRSRWLTVGLPLLVCAILVIALSIRARFQYQDSQQQRFF